MFADKGNGTPSYTCYSYRERPGECERFNVNEKVILRETLKQLRVEFFDKYLTAENVERIKAAMRQQLSGKRSDVAIVESHLQKIEAQLQQAKRRLVEVDADMVRHVTERIRELEDNRDSLRSQMEASNQPAEFQISNVEQRIKAAIGWLEELEKIVDTDYSGPIVNNMLRQFIDKIDVHIERVQWGTTGKRFKCNLVGGTVFFKLNGLPSGFGSLSTTAVR